MARTNGKRSQRSAGKKSQKPSQRVRFGKLPKPPETVEVPYGTQREELKGLSCGELTEIVISTEAFREEVGSICSKLEAKRAQRGPKPVYSSLECEIVFVYQRVCGLRSVKEARDRLAGDRAEDARRLFGFDYEREKPKQVQKLRPGVPSESTLCRHRRRFGEKRRRGAYERLFQRLVREHLIEFPEMQEEARLLSVDGTKVETHYQCPKYDTKSGKLINEESVTCWDGGFVGQGATADKTGHGYNAVIMTTNSGLPLAHKLTPLNSAESAAAREIVRHAKRDLVPLFKQEELHLLAADGAFHSHALRKELHQCGIVEQVHRVSHGDSERSRRNAQAHDRDVFLIDGYPNWRANGHRELCCLCGQGKVWKDVKLKDGRAVVRTSGDCKKCGRISITAGTWRAVKNVGRKGQKGFRHCQPGEYEEADWSFGNPLTYNDPLATVYGKKRFAHGEGLNGALERRFGITKGKRWFRRADQARTDLALVFSIIHSLAIEQRRRAATTAQDTGPPGRAAA